MAQINKNLNGLRALAKEETGRDFRYADEAPLRIQPWANKADLIADLLHGLGCMAVVSEIVDSQLLDPSTRQKSEWLMHEITYQLNQLTDAGFFTQADIPKGFKPDRPISREDVLSDYQDWAMNKATEIDASDASLHGTISDRSSKVKR